MIEVVIDFKAFTEDKVGSIVSTKLVLVEVPYLRGVGRAFVAYTIAFKGLVL